MAKKKADKKAASYEHSEEKQLMRPEIGVQAQFKQKKPPKQYRYDSSLDPEMSWDEGICDLRFTRPLRVLT